MSGRYKVMCCCECCISAKSIHSSLLSWRDHYLRKLNNLIQNSQDIRSGEKDNRLFETYKFLLYHMGAIYMQQQLTCPWLKCVHIHHPNMHYHIGNLCCVVLIIAHVLIFQTNNDIHIIPTHILQYVFIFIT